MIYAINIVVDPPMKQNEALARRMSRKPLTSISLIYVCLSGRFRT